MNKCDSKTLDFIKNKIYRNKIVIFGSEKCEATRNAMNLFVKKYNHQPEMVDVGDNEVLKDCLIKKTKGNVIPIVFITGMFAGSYSNVELMHERNDLDILFKYV
jgi:glutaredoxin-related protein